MKTIFVTILFCVLMVGCTSKPGQNPAVDSINNSVGINDTLGLSLHPEYPVYSTKKKQITFVLDNNSGADIDLGGYYSYTYEDEKEYGGMCPCNLLYLLKKSCSNKAVHIIIMRNCSGIFPVVIAFS